MTSGLGATFAYDENNRMVSANESSGGQERYWYGPDGKRLWRLMADGSEQFTLYRAHGDLLGTYSNMGMAGHYCWSAVTLNVSFAGRLIWQGAPGQVPIWYGGHAGVVLMDRLGTNRAGGARFRPYGDEITSSANDREKFGAFF